MNRIDDSMALRMANNTAANCETWKTEEESAADFDRRVEICIRAGVFDRAFKEVRGFYLTHRPGREEKDARIDRILIPGPKLKERGWTRTIGVELKRSDCDFGPAVSQAIDYTYCNWNIGDYWMYCERIFLWPFAMPGGPLQSVMLGNGVGVVHSSRYPGYPQADRLLMFTLERNQIVVLPDGELEIVVPTKSGTRKGSR